MAGQNRGGQQIRNKQNRNPQDHEYDRGNNGQGSQLGRPSWQRGAEDDEQEHGDRSDSGRGASRVGQDSWGDEETYGNGSLYGRGGRGESYPGREQGRGSFQGSESYDAGRESGQGGRSQRGNGWSGSRGGQGGDDYAPDGYGQYGREEGSAGRSFQRSDSFRGESGNGQEGYAQGGGSRGYGQGGASESSRSLGGRYGTSFSGSQSGAWGGRSAADDNGWSRDQQSSRGGQHAGKGPKGYQRSDDRIREDVSEALAQHAEIDASEIEVEVAKGQVTLTGSVTSRAEKRAAEDAAEEVSGVKDVENRLRVQTGEQSHQGSNGAMHATMGSDTQKDGDSKSKARVTAGSSAS